MNHTMNQTIENIPVERIENTVRHATHEVFSTMLNLPLEDLPAREEITSEPPDSHDGVEALVGIGGAWTGTGRIWCNSKFACKLASALLMAEYDSLNEEVLDAISEVANMIIGNVKATFEDSLGALVLSIPTVIFGRNYRTRSAGVTSWIVVPFKAGDEELQVRFFLMPTKGHAPVQPARPEMVHTL